MKAAELIEILSGVDPESEIRLATQPNYPLCHSVLTAKVETAFDREEMRDARLIIDDPDCTEEEKQEARNFLKLHQDDLDVVYLVEGQYVGYASRDLWNV